MSKPVSNINYYEQQQCSVQWRAFLNAFSVEFSAQGDVNDLRTFMYKLGLTMAASFKVDGGETLLTLESGINKVWADLDWGWVQLRDESDCLLIEHNASPLKVAFGEQALDWSPALLEGVYSYWFESMGIDKSLRLSQRGAVLDDGLLIVFQLKKQVEEQAYFTRR
ncbi:cellulose biosynthesis protein BcsD [Undibacterium sp. RTI2.1]|uniref:cellulose biosynthesis protein BcsD n=1 Tax=unclassified Undibacterium TaxID=2630295 RepID=UPI002AB3463D|nr:MULTISPECIES: cellulose biosynthesis protein BcsD [unclassified Undibacterium]MDY7538501.1 cellulose biosynthesis protein BcsD [Undibacterium sp. 5I1]MEB0031952.1 cellulose biosynthesis protein BcsD [Undibacterium sp. RTI2.1]MEB0114874.1 cellulose biosynthesis protein BcsD [Undibacterium sp. RTI2.2]MEB0231532.1 cellulose biosynthesis protein BcsD [Undibacterium sp. 10I3]MEB0255833.1 cellulose biosynthesis protein BcsD [Undibacterium sp. 5I1]